jgi:tRNA dimethylallyltransferase
MPKQLLIICGPTGVGKSTLAMALARQWHCPIISADSRQIYKYLDIGTDKPGLKERSEVTHYLIDFLELDQSFNVGQYKIEASKIMNELFKIHKRLILCGGTGLYIKALIDGLDEMPTSTIESRYMVEKNFKEGGLEKLQTLLKEIDPEYYFKSDIQNYRRVSRALEVYFTSGKNISQFHLQNKSKLDFDYYFMLLNKPRPELYQRIERRVDQMIQNGLINETKEFLAFRNFQCMQTVGYKEIIAYLDNTLSADEAINLIKQHSRNYAKRQLTWFKKYATPHEIDPDNILAIQKIMDEMDKDIQID